MSRDIYKDFITSLGEKVTVTITPNIWAELLAYHPDRYGKTHYKMDRLDEETLRLATEDYFNIVIGYLLAYQIPILTSTLCAGFLWSVDKLNEQGLSKAPLDVKKIIGQMRDDPLSSQLESKI